MRAYMKGAYVLYIFVYSITETIKWGDEMYSGSITAPKTLYIETESSSSKLTQSGLRNTPQSLL